jgi:hypothetical protein
VTGPPRAIGTATLLLGVAVALASGCRKEGNPVRGALDAVAAAAEKRDAAALMSRVSAAYAGEGGETRAEVEATVRRTLAAYEELHVTLSDVKVDRTEAGARATFRAELSGVPSKAFGLDAWLPRSSEWSFEVRLVEEKKGWKVASARWSRLDGG